MPVRLLGICAGVVASTCCAVPLLLVAVGLGSTGLGGFFGRYHWYLQGAALLLLAAAWFKHLQGARACSTDACPPAYLKSTRNVLTLASLFVFLFVGNQLLLEARRQGAQARSEALVAAQAVHLSSLTVPVKGMTCQGCEKVIEKNVGALEGVDRVKASAVAENVVVVFDPSRILPEAIAEAIRATGYEPSLGAEAR